MTESKKERKSLLMRMKEESEKAGLNPILKKKKKKTKIMASSAITSRQIEWQKVKAKQWQISSSWAVKSLWMVTAAMKLEYNCFLAGKLWKT